MGWDGMGWGTSRHVTAQTLVEGVEAGWTGGYRGLHRCYIGTRCTWYGEAPARVILGQSRLVTLFAPRVYSASACAVRDGKMREDHSR